MKKLICLVLAGVFTLGILTGCGSSSKNSQTTSSEQSQNTKEKSPEKITLTFTHDLVEEVEGGAAIAFKESIARVTKDHPEITIVEDVLPDTSCYTKIKTLAAGNELPDLFVMRGDLLDMLVSSDLVGAIEEDINADSEWKNGFLPGVFDVFTRNNKIYGVPTSCKSTALAFYNEEILKDCGINEFPKTFNELKDAVTKIKNKGYTPISLGNKEQWVAQSCILSSLGDRFTGTDWFMSMKDNKGAKFTDANFVNSLVAMKELADLGAFNSDMNSIDNMQQRTPYYNKKAAMFFEGAWAIGDIVNDGPEDVVKATHVALVPTVEGGKGNPNSTSGGASVAFAMSKLDGAKRAAAIEVLKELSGPEYGVTMTEYNKFPAVKPGKYDENKITPLAKEYNTIIDKSVFSPVYDIYLSPALSDMINVGIQELLIGKTTPEKLSEKIQAEHEKTFK